jgi:hypothetical protein
MRKYIQRQLLELIYTLWEGIQYATAQESEASSAITVIQDCYLAIDAIDNTLKNNLSEERYMFYGEINSRIKVLIEGLERNIEVKEDIGEAADKIKESIILLDNELFNEAEVKLEIAFMPYKASMWDSLESIWLTAKADPSCEVYVVPIPYYDRDTDHSFTKYHYEGEKFPSEVPITHYNDYKVAVRKPDIIYIHNPYDNQNFVTSVDPNYYSFELKKHTDTLVYVPYYSTSGGMSVGQKFCSAYYYADYIVMQAEKYRGFFDPSLPQEKLLAMGSPKFDRVIRICNNPPEPPEAWKAKMKGKKVYFYNTSISGMLGNTELFLKKMKYVFETFAFNDDVCLLWRPHPLLETTFDTMRPQYKNLYLKLKNFFLEKNLGIYDDTPDITNTIAHCDAYIGDSGTSVVSLFGIAGKPIFILNNNIIAEPSEEDWRGEIIPPLYVNGDNQWVITRGNKLYNSPEKNYKYKYLCDLSDYASKDYYSYAINYGDKTYICPKNAQHIVVIKENKIEKYISLERFLDQPGAFSGAIRCGKYIFLIPLHYPAIVRYDTSSDEIRYFTDNLDVFISKINGATLVGGYCVQNGYLFLASAVDNQVLAIEAESGKEQVLTNGATNRGGCMILTSDGNNLWFMPFIGAVITCWNPESGEVREYTNFPSDLKCKHISYGIECMERPFNRPAFSGDYVYIPPYWANKYIKLNRVTGKAVEWNPPFDTLDNLKNGYYPAWCKAWFINSTSEDNKYYKLFSLYDRKLYLVDLENNKCEEMKIEFDIDELRENEPGFESYSEWLQYCCEEGAFNTLSDFIEGKITGKPFNKEKQLSCYGDIAANNDGTCGEKLHQFIREQLRKN